MREPFDFPSSNIGDLRVFVCIRMDNVRNRWCLLWLLVMVVMVMFMETAVAVMWETGCCWTTAVVEGSGGGK